MEAGVSLRLTPSDGRILQLFNHLLTFIIHSYYPSVGRPPSQSTFMLIQFSRSPATST